MAAKGNRRNGYVVVEMVAMEDAMARWPEAMFAAGARVRVAKRRKDVGGAARGVAGGGRGGGCELKAVANGMKVMAEKVDEVEDGHEGL